ncbi:MAG: DUF305 domain-containing protein [Chitinophagaceae bacterium]
MKRLIILIILFEFVQNIHAQIADTISASGKKEMKSAHKMHMNADANQQKIKHAYLLMMDSMMLKMDTVTLTTSLEHNFLLQMIPHHQGAVSMAKYQLENGRDPEMLQLAKSILAEQQYEIQEMNKMLSLLSDITIIDIGKYKTEMDKTMIKMMHTMPSSNETLNNIDMNFAGIMLPHHQAAIDMSLALLLMNPNKLLTNLASKIIAQQELEVAQMKDYINKHKKY